MFLHHVTRLNLQDNLATEGTEATTLRNNCHFSLLGVHLVPGRWLLTQRSQPPTLCQCLRLHVSPAASLCSSRTEPQRSTQPHSTDDRKARDEEEEEEEGPEYIPKKKAKNPMVGIGYAW